MQPLEARWFLTADPVVTVDTNFGNFKLELFASAAPKTVANFLTYVDSGAYNNSIIQRNATSDGTATGSPFVIQGGGFTTSSTTFTSGSQLTAVTSGATVPDESHADNPNNPHINTTGTIAMALSTGPNSGINQWFINLADNPELDDTSDGGPFTVFGQVIDNGMTTVINPTVAKLTGGNGFGYPSENPPVGPGNQLFVFSSMTVDGIDGTVFSDTNGNGQLDTGEPGVPGRTVFLNNDGTGAPDANNPSTTTDANGNYSFTGLVAGTYNVREVLPSGLLLTTPDQKVTVAADQTAAGVNFGESPFTGTGVTFAAIEGQTFAGAVSTISDANTSDTAAEFAATINWGDGGSSTGTVTGSAGAFTVTGTHTYGDEGNFTISVQVTDTQSVPAVTAIATASATVSDADTLTAIGTTIAATANQTFSGTVATFTDGYTAAAGADFSATINWGDGKSSTGTVTGTGGTFTVSGSHTYAAGGTESVTVTLADNPPGTATATATSTANVAASVVVPTAPTDNPDTFVLGPGGTLSGSGATGMLANDISADNQPQKLLATVVVTTTHGNLTWKPDGSFTYTPLPGFLGIDRFSYFASENGAAGNTVTVTLLTYHASLVDKLYHQVLHRSAEDSGLEFWTSLLDLGLPLDSVAAGIFNSPERLNPLVNQFYEMYLHRPAEPAGLAAWVAVWQTEGDPGDVEVDILSSDEFYNDAGDTVDGFVWLLYERVLSRPADPKGLNDWDAALNSGQFTRKQIAAGFIGSHERHVNLVDFLFGEYFNGVSPLPSTLPYVTDLDNGETQTQVEKAIIDSSDYGNNPPEPAAGAVGRALYPH